MRSSSAAAMVMSVVLLGLGCPGDDGSAGDSEGTSTSTGAVTGTTSAADDTEGASGTGPISVCGEPPDAMVGPMVTVEISNATANGVWMPLENHCYFSVPYAFDGPSGPVSWVGPDCGTCQSYAQGICECPGAPCSEETLMYLEPGATATWTWSGGEYWNGTLPADCPGVAQCGASCQALVQSPPGSYIFYLRAGEMAVGCDTEPCACEPVDGRCTIYDPGATVSGAAMYIASLEFPDETTVVLTIE